MRITGGEWRGRVLKAPEGLDVRPTSDKMRQAIFNILRGMGLPEGAHVLDGFCGTGALGLEALSQGAASCLFLDSSAKSLQCCAANIAALQAGDRAQTLKADLTALKQKSVAAKSVDLFFLDPPYRKSLVAPALQALKAGGWLAQGAIGVVETEKEMDVLAEGFSALDTRSYGDSGLTLLQYV